VRRANSDEAQTLNPTRDIGVHDLDYSAGSLKKDQYYIEIVHPMIFLRLAPHIPSQLFNLGLDSAAKTEFLAAWMSLIFIAVWTGPEKRPDMALWAVVEAACLTIRCNEWYTATSS